MPSLGAPRLHRLGFEKRWPTSRSKTASQGVRGGVFGRGVSYRETRQGARAVVVEDRVSLLSKL